MTRLHASCPLTEGDAWMDTDDGPRTLAERSCPLTGQPVRMTPATTGARDGEPVVHNRLECPQPCMAQWWVDSTDGCLSWAGSDLVVDWPDLEGDLEPPAEAEEGPAEPFLWPSQHHGAERPGEQSLMDWAQQEHGIA